MKKKIVVLDTDAAECQQLSSLLSSFSVTFTHSLPQLQQHLSGSDCHVMLIDLDTVSIDNRALVQIKRQHPKIEIITKSERTFHPELEEALRSHILACLAKPLDFDELIFWLKSIFENNAPSDNPLDRIHS